METKLMTPGDVARMAGCSIFNVDYVVRSRGIPPDHRAGIIRLYKPASVKRIITELRAIAKQNERGAATSA